MTFMCCTVFYVFFQKWQLFHYISHGKEFPINSQMFKKKRFYLLKSGQKNYSSWLRVLSKMMETPDLICSTDRARMRTFPFTAYNYSFMFHENHYIQGPHEQRSLLFLSCRRMCVCVCVRALLCLFSAGAPTVNEGCQDAARQ